MPATESIVHVDVPVETAYNQWTQFETFPEFMYGITEVRQLDDRHMHWVMEAEGRRSEMDTEIIEQRPNELISWRDVATGRAALVTFSTEGDGTRVTLMVDTEGAPSLPEKIWEAIFGIAGKQDGADLERFKTFIEGRHQATGAWRGEIEPHRKGEVVDV